MKIGLVIGQVIATRKDEKLVGCKLLITQPLTPEKKPRGETVVAVDSVGAGVGEYVLYVSGSVAPKALRDFNTPIDAVIVGIIDKIEL
ncbi:MAG: EutN/CcmL family microcompartment protein [Acidaminococcales bacterium]|jgi:ethanolamine utilization protein EutN|nr:EutN/CcmL family microcompartment protein [Acidaminococcales bacterium]